VTVAVPVAALPGSLGQLGLNRGLLLIGTGGQPHIVAGMVVEHAQRMTAPLAEREVALEIHLPELVGARALKARMGRGGRRWPPG
jgi:hypothetical protein